MPNACDLHVHSGFSTYDGLGSPEGVVDRAVALGWGAVCLTEHGWLGSAPALYRAAKNAGIKPIIGCELYVSPEETLIDGDKKLLQSRRHLTALALSLEGYQNLVAWVSASMQRPAYYNGPRISLDRMAEIAPHPLHHNAILSGCMGGELCQCLLHGNGSADAAAKLYLESARDLFPNFYVELQNHQLDKFFGIGLEDYERMVEDQATVREQLLELAQEFDLPVVVTNDSHYQESAQRKTHIAMLARKSNAKDRLTSKSFVSKYFYWANYMRSMEQVADTLPKWAAKQSIESIHEIVDEANIALEPLDKFSYCVHPSTKVLTLDLRWVEAKKLVVGTEIWGFDEEAPGGRGQQRHWRKSVVLEAGRSVLPSFRVSFDDGAVLVVSSGHQWLARKRDGKATTGVEWRETKDIEVGDKIPRILEVWEDIDSWEAGWLAGFFDGEGYLDSTCQMRGSQLPGSVLALALTVCEELGYEPRTYKAPKPNSDDCVMIRPTASIADSLKLIGSVRPIRLLEKVPAKLEGLALHGRAHRQNGALSSAMRNRTVTSVESLGRREVVTLSTSTKTFLAEGFAAHNSLPRSAYKNPVDEVVRRSKPRLKNMVARHGSLAQDRFDYEVDAMREFAHYLLIYSDIIRMCRSQGIYTWTRGSAANSLVNYCLRVHEIDPIHYKLMFERFVNPARAKFPDVDIDIEAHRQPDVARMVTEYMAEQEGSGNVMPICTFSTMANRNVFRMMAEAAGVPKERIDELAKLLPQMIDSGMVQDDEEAYTLLAEEYGTDIYANARAVFDQVSGVSQHACAFALGTEDRPLALWVPSYRIGSSDSVVTQYNMKWIEELGFQKLDLLRLDTLTIMHSIARQLGMDMAWLDEIGQSEPGVYELDETTAEMLKGGRTEGVHSMQGNTQRRGCVEVLPDSIEDLVAIEALYRPSGTRTGLDKHYVDRRHGREDWQAINDFVGEYTNETFGIAIYQEQIMAMAFGMGMSGAEVDDLYKAVKTAKGIGRGAKELFDELEPTFRKHAKKLMPQDEADLLWAEWDKLQGYTFNRGHATSYAILAAKTAILKAHFPQEFFVALLERYPEKHHYLAAAISEGFKFEPPDVNTSGRGFSRGSDAKSIRVGLVRINGIGDGTANAIVRNQPFSSVDDLVERVGSNYIKQGEKVNTREILAASGALESLDIKGNDDDLAQLQHLNFVLHKPRAFQGCKPQLGKRRNGAWQFLGLQRDIQITEGKAFCAKLFWVPENPTFVTKTSATGKYNAHLLTVVDENGIPFDLIVAEDKEHEANTLMALADAEGAVITCEGKVSMPFLRDGNTGFRMWGISGAENGNPQCWHMSEKKAKYISREAKAKASERNR